MSTVGATSVRLTKPSRCVVVERSRPGAKPGAADATRRSRRRGCCGGFGPTHHHHVGAVDVFEQPPDDAVGRPRSAWARIRTACSSDAKRDCEVGAYEVGALDQHHRTGRSTRRRTRAPPGRGRAGHRTAPRRRAAAAPGSTRPPGTLPSLVISAATAARRQGEDTRLGRARVGAVAVGDHTRGRCRRCASSSPSRPDLGAVELAVVGCRWSSVIGMYTSPLPAGMPVRVVNTSPARSRPNVSSTPKPWPPVEPFATARAPAPRVT